MEERAAGLGHNNPPLPEQIAQARAELPEQVTAYLGEHYKDRLNQVEELLECARAIPQVIEDDDSMGRAAKIIKEMRDLSKALDTAREAEKSPYYRSGQSADNFFFALVDKVARRVRTNRPGAADVLQARVDAYNQHKLAAEQERRRQEDLRLRREAEEAAARQREKDREAEEARLAAERARKPEIAAQKDAVAGLREAEAADAAVDSQVAQAASQEAHVATFAKPADMVRQRVDDGPTVTMKTETYALVTDFALLDAAMLWPFIDDAAKERALRAWARTVNFNKQMAGAEIGRRPVTVVR